MTTSVTQARLDGILPESNWHLVSLDRDQVVVTIAGKTWSFEIENNQERNTFSSLQQQGETCWGCNTLPTNGARTAKIHWCQLSRLISNKQEAMLRDNPEHPIDICPYSDDEDEDGVEQ